MIFLLQIKLGIVVPIYVIEKSSKEELGISKTNPAMHPTRTSEQFLILNIPSAVFHTVVVLGSML